MTDEMNEKMNVNVEGKDEEMKEHKVKYWIVRFRINESIYKSKREAPLITQEVPFWAARNEDELYNWVWNWCSHYLGTNWEFRITSKKIIEKDW